MSQKLAQDSLYLHQLAKHHNKNSILEIQFALVLYYIAKNCGGWIVDNESLDVHG